MNGHVMPPPRRPHHTARRPPSASRKPDHDAASSAAANDKSSSSRPTSPHSPSERTVKMLRLSKSLTVPEGATVSEACRRMAARRLDAALLTDAKGLLSGIITAEDIATRVVAEGLRPDQTIASKVMTRNPVFVMADSPAIEAMQKMIQGKFRHLPVVENGEVTAMLDITKFLYDAISRMEKAEEQGSAIAAAVEGVERQLGSNFPASQAHAFIDSLRERMFKPSLSTVIPEKTNVPEVSHTDPVYFAAKKMREFRVNSVVVMAGSTLQGILTSKDVLLRVVAQNLSPELTLVEKVMTSNPECATLDTSVLDALHSMHDGKFQHIPVLDRDGHVAACLDVLQLTHAAISLVEGSGGAVNDMAHSMMQNFWNSALAMEPPDEEHDSEASGLMVAESVEGKYTHPIHVGNSFAFKIEDLKGRMNRFICVPESLDELVSAARQRIGVDDKEQIHLLYEDDEGDRVLLTSDTDLAAAVHLARSASWKVLRLYVDGSDFSNEATRASSKKGRSFITVGVMAGALVIASIGVLVYLKRSDL